MRWLLWLLILIALAALALYVAGRLGWLAGRMPNDLGVRDGRLKMPSRTENSVSSQARLWADSGARVDYAQIAPFPLPAEPAAAIERLRGIVAAMPGARVIETRADYLYAQFTTPRLGFVDDVEFYAAPSEGVVHLRSASRIGRRDFGVNRARIEAIRAAYLAR